MDRVTSLFERKGSDILSVYFTAGYPTVDSTAEIINALDKAGIDMIEVGAPFSDPMADGPVIQGSSTEALRQGMTLEKLFEQVEKARKTSPDIPLVLMGYLNPMMQYGYRRLFERCESAGIDALIIPDLPMEEYLAEIHPLSIEFNKPVIMLITPETSEERIREIDSFASGFIYMVSSASTTGTRTEGFSEEQTGYFKRINGMNLRNPRLIGFGISDPVTREQANNHSSGAIIGSLFIKCLSRNNTPEEAVADLLKTVGL
ncbi:MAG: tryptophan synthase subunit alpha [Paramuribaculum sp.]|nr:tryptophan synthase subunit alpha [Paramuribaculum sp.]